MYKIAQVQEPYSSIRYIAERIDLPKKLGLEEKEAWSSWLICEEFAIKKGFLTSGAARPDVYRAANYILRMVNDGVKVEFSLKPPGFHAIKIVHGNKIEHESAIEDDGDEEQEEKIIKRSGFEMLDEENC